MRAPFQPADRCVSKPRGVAAVCRLLWIRDGELWARFLAAADHFGDSDEGSVSHRIAFDDSVVYRGHIDGGSRAAL